MPAEKIYWLSQLASDVPEDANWLSPDEKAILATLKIPKRNMDWRLGRWTAKNTIIHHLLSQDTARHAHEITVKAAPDGAPEAFIHSKPAPFSISISHSSGTGFCVIDPRGGAIGCDIEKVEPREEVFVKDYFTHDEQATVFQADKEDQETLITLIWSAKESVLKALREGLRLDTRSIQVILPRAFQVTAAWQPFIGHYQNRVMHGQWRFELGLVWTVVGEGEGSEQKLVRF